MAKRCDAGVRTRSARRTSRRAAIGIACAARDDFVDKVGTPLSRSAPPSRGARGGARLERRPRMPPMNHAELAWEFADLFAELDVDQINEILAKNVPLETLDFFTKYAETFASAMRVEGPLAGRLPNLLLMGYLLRVLEERLLEGDGSDDDGFDPDA
jgi:hypothetical protein